VSGLAAANLAVTALGQGKTATILDTEEDEVQVQLGKRVLKGLRNTYSTVLGRPPPSPLPNLIPRF